MQQMCIKGQNYCKHGRRDIGGTGGRSPTNFRWGTIHVSVPQYLEKCCGDLYGGLGDGPQQTLGGGRSMYPSPNIWRSVVIVCVRKYELSKKCCRQGIFREGAIHLRCPQKNPVFDPLP